MKKFLVEDPIFARVVLVGEAVGRLRKRII
jgi:hypothetical protein